MTKIFLSYSTQDTADLDVIERQLTARGFEIWRDKSCLQAGSKWPMRLGETMAECDGLLLLWSANAAPSSFVELEWNIAIALKKNIIPVLRDDTPLPASLTAFHGIRWVSSQESVLRIVAALQGWPPPSVASRADSVLDTLTQFDEPSTRDVLASIEKQIQKNDWSVSDDVIQIHGDVTIQNKEATKEQASSGSRLNRWAAIITIVAGSLTVVAISFDLPVKITSLITTTNPAKQQRIAGTLYDEVGNPLANVKILLPEYNQHITSNALGRYTFNLTAELGTETELITQMPGYETRNQYVSPGDENYNILMKKTQ